MPSSKGPDNSSARLSDDDEKLVCRVLLERYEKCVSGNFFRKVLAEGDGGAVGRHCGPIFADLQRFCGSYLRGMSKGGGASNL